MSCGVSRRHGSDLALLWLWCRPVAVTPIRPLAWEPPYAMGAALKRQKKKNFFFVSSSQNDWVIGQDVEVKHKDLLFDIIKLTAEAIGETQ